MRLIFKVKETPKNSDIPSLSIMVTVTLDGLPTVIDSDVEVINTVKS